MFDIIKKDFGKNSLLYTISNKNGFKVMLADVGASITGIYFPDKFGNSIEVAFGSDNIDFYSAKFKNGHMGATTGRVAGRTIGAKFLIDNIEYRLTANKGEDHTHGGVDGLSYVFYSSKIIDNNIIEFSYLSKDGEEGYPGNLDLKVRYTITEDNALIIDYYATTDKKTPVNIMNHSYFNLNGSGKINNHKIFIDAKYYLAEDENGITTGEIKKTENTIYDFSSLKYINDAIEKNNGIDNCYIFSSNDITKKRVEVLAEESGIGLEVYTTKPSILFYTANHLNNLEVRGQKLNSFEAFCLEAQYFSSALNYNHFPSIILDVNEEYRHRTIYKLFNF